MTLRPDFLSTHQNSFEKYVSTNHVTTVRKEGDSLGQSLPRIVMSENSTQKRSNRLHNYNDMYQYAVEQIVQSVTTRKSLYYALHWYGFSGKDETASLLEHLPKLFVNSYRSGNDSSLIH